MTLIHAHGDTAALQPSARARLNRVGRAAGQALHRLAREPRFWVPAVAMLAIGVATMTTVFTIVHGVILRPLSYADPEGLVVIRHAASRVELPMHGVSAGLVHFYRANNRVFSDVAMYSEDQVPLTDLDRPEQVRIAYVTPAILAVLRPQVFVGRWLPGGVFGPARFTGVLISHELWVRRYGADPTIVGRVIELERRHASVDGVLPPGFGFPHSETDVWDAVNWPDVDASDARLRELSYGAVARLKRGVSIAAATADLNRLTRSFSGVFNDVKSGEVQEMGLRASVVPLKDAMIGDVRTPLLLLLIAAGFLAVITVANATNLALVRSMRLRRTLAVERALGASAFQLALRFLLEGVILGGVAAAIGLGVAGAAVRAHFGFPPDAIPRLGQVHIDGAVVALALALAVITGAVVGGIAWVNTSRTDVARALSSSGRTTSNRREQMLGRALVGAQVALTLALMIGSALMAESFWRLSQVRLGFAARSAAIFSLPIPPLSVARNDASEVPFLYHRVAKRDLEVMERLRTIPGIEGVEAASASGFPLTPVGSSARSRIAVAHAALEPGASWPFAQRSFATPGYFRLMGIPIIRGRTFEYDDTGRSNHGVILSQSLARELFGERDPVGRSVQWAARPDSPPLHVVGVAGDVPSETLRDGPTKVLYLPNVYPPKADTITGVLYWYIPNNETFVVRSTLPLAAVASHIQRAVRELDPRLLVTRIGTVEQLIANDTARTRLTLLLLLIASAVALASGLVGIYGVLAYTVSHRAKEFGIRIALGQVPAHVVWMIVGQGARIAGIGIGAGLVTAALLTRYLRSVLYQVSPSDPRVFGAMALLLAIVACVASFLPAWRAGRADPVQALKTE